MNFNVRSSSLRRPRDFKSICKLLFIYYRLLEILNILIIEYSKITTNIFILYYKQIIILGEITSKTELWKHYVAISPFPILIR